MSKHLYSDIIVPINEDNLCIKRNFENCIICGACKNICMHKASVSGNYDLEKTGDNAICTGCGQCMIACPVEAITEVKDYLSVKKVLSDKSKTVIFQTAPAVRTALGDEFGINPKDITGQMVTALKKLGASYVLDTTVGADITIMEETTELINNLGKKTMFTSCCPAWVKYVEYFKPELINNISTTKSPISIFSTIIKTYLKDKYNLNNIVVVALVPCTAKKGEIKRDELMDSSKYNKEDKYYDTDYAITVKELCNMLMDENIDIHNLDKSDFDNLITSKTGGSYLFGQTSGVATSAIREIYKRETGLYLDEVNFTENEDIHNLFEYNLNVNGKTIKVAKITGMSNVNKLLDKISNNEIHYDFVEVMSCDLGCVGGAGMPKIDPIKLEETRLKRQEILKKLDMKTKIKVCSDNEDIKALYNEFLVNDNIKEDLLHTSYVDRSSDLNINN